MEDLANIYHTETKPWIKTIQGFALVVQCYGGEVPFFFLSSNSNYYKKATSNKSSNLNLLFPFYRYCPETSGSHECAFTDVFHVRPEICSVFNNTKSRLGLTSWTTQWHKLRIGLLCSRVVRRSFGSQRCRRDSSRNRRDGSHGDRLVIDWLQYYIQSVRNHLFRCVRMNVYVGSPSGNFAGGYLFDRFGSIVSFEIISCTALVIGTIQLIVNQTLNGLSKRKKLNQ